MTLNFRIDFLVYVLTIGQLIYGFDQIVTLLKIRIQLQKPILPLLFLFEMKAEIFRIF
jgi:hypothetical protein